MFIAQRVLCAISDSTPKAKYYRVVWLSTQSAGSTNKAYIAELVFATSAGGDQIEGFTPFASSGAGAAGAFDGDLNTGWMSAYLDGSFPMHLGVEYATPKGPTHLRLTAGIYGSAFDPKGYNQKAPKTFIVEASNDGATYTTIYTSATQSNWASNEVREFKIQ